MGGLQRFTGKGIKGVFKTLNSDKVYLYASVCCQALLRSYIFCVFTLACAALAFGIACIAAAMARPEAAAVCFSAAWVVSFIMFLFKQPAFKTPDEDNGPWLTWVSFVIGNCAAAWVILRCLPWSINLAKTWKLF